MISPLTSALISLIAFVRVVRVEPHTSLLLFEKKTSRLALASQAVSVGLVVSAVLGTLHPKIESMLAGSLLGELVALCVITFVTYDFFGRAIRDYITAVICTLFVVVAVALLIQFSDYGDNLGGRLVFGGSAFAILLAIATLVLPGSYRRSYTTSKAVQIQPVDTSPIVAAE